MPLPVNKHLGVLAQEKTEGLSGQISQLKIHQLLSTGSLVVGPVELNGVNKQSLLICQNLYALLPVSPLTTIHSLRSISLPLLQRIRDV